MLQILSLICKKNMIKYVVSKHTKIVSKCKQQLTVDVHRLVGLTLWHHFYLKVKKKPNEFQRRYILYNISQLLISHSVASFPTNILTLSLTVIKIYSRLLVLYISCILYISIKNGWIKYHKDQRYSKRQNPKKLNTDVNFIYIHSHGHGWIDCPVAAESEYIYFFVFLKLCCKNQENNTNLRSKLNITSLLLLAWQTDRQIEINPR